MGYQSISFSAGEQPTTSKWNILGTNDSSFNDGSGVANLTLGATTAVKNSYKFNVYRSAAFTSSNVFSVVLFDTKVFDTGSNVDIVTNKGRFTAPIAGFYFFSASVGNTTATATELGVAIYVNGASRLVGTMIDPSAATSSGTKCHVSGLVQMAANDYAETYFVGGNGSTVEVGQSACWFSGFYLSST